MHPSNIKKLNYRDEVASRHRRFFVLKVVAFVLGTIVVIAGLTYLLFFSRLFDVREVGFNGLDTVSSDELREKIDENLNQKIFSYLPRRNNIFFVNTGNFEKEFASTYPVLKSVDVQKKLLHSLVLNFLERKPAGIWCFNTLDAGCSYFDNDKVLWGQPAKSSGFIFLTVDDQREKAEREIDDDFFKPIMKVAGDMPGEIKSIVIPADSFNEFRVYVADYYIIFATDSAIQNQLDVLKIFLNEKTKDAPPVGDFRPQYIDLRIDGRVYYK